MKRLLLIDTHALIHRFFHAVPMLTTPKGEPINAIYGLAGIFLKILKPDDGSFAPDFIAVATDRPEPTFRKEAYAEYKGTRVKADDALISQFHRLPDLFSAFGLPIFSVAGFEADDVIGTFVERFKGEKDLRIIILSGDRDLLQLVEGDRIVMNILKSGMDGTELCGEAGVLEKYGVEPIHLVDYKGLVGDASDNIPGVTGIGPKAALEVLKEFKTLENVYDNLGLIKKSVAEKLEAQKKMAFLSRELATIRRDVPLPPTTLDDLKSPVPTKEMLGPLFTELGFKNFLQRLG